MTWSEWVEMGDWRRPEESFIHVPPTLTADVMPLLTDRDVSVLQLTQLISKEQVLATRVLRLANAAYCAPLQEVTTINDAIVRMGTAAVRNVVFAVCFASRVQGAAVYGTRARALADHAVGTAYLARMLAEHADLDPEEAFLHGLLHDIGKLLLLKLASESASVGGPRPSAEEVEAYSVVRHASLGAELLSDWGLPISLREPIKHHHDPATSEKFRDEAAVIYIANRLSHRYGFGCPIDPAGDDALLQDAECQRLHVSAAWLASADARAPGLFKVARQIVS